MGKLVKIVNSNGRIGRVSEKYRPLVTGKIRRAPSEAAIDPSPEGAPDVVPDPEPGDDEVETPAHNARTEIWRQYAVSKGLSEDEAAALSRDQLVARFTTTEE